MKTYFEDEGKKFFILGVEEVVSTEVKKGTIRKILDTPRTYTPGPHNYRVYKNYYVRVRMWIENFERTIILNKSEYKKFVLS